MFTITLSGFFKSQLDHLTSAVEGCAGTVTILPRKVFAPRDSPAGLSNLELLKIWSETTPRAIFPQRNIGALEEGYEANSIVLEGNPIQDFSRVKRIRIRVKQGDPLK